MDSRVDLVLEHLKGHLFVHRVDSQVDLVLADLDLGLVDLDLGLGLGLVDLDLDLVDLEAV